MDFTFQEIEDILNKFEQEYFKPNLEFMHTCSLGKIGMKGEVVPIRMCGDLCILVGLRKPLPQNFSVPAEYRGVKVLCQVTPENLLR